jgi:hypothetical protein
MASNLDSKSVFAEIAAMDDAYCDGRRDEFVPLINEMQRASTPRDFMVAQLKLRDTFAGRQAGLDEIRARRTADKAELRRLAPRKPQPRTHVRELSARVAIRSRILLRDDVIQHMTRCLADALVWRAARYDRALFAVAGDGERVGRFPGEDGAKAERDQAQEIWDSGALPFFNDLTNCLRVGDLTVLYEDGGVPQLREIKRSGRHLAGTRQAERLDRATKLLSDGCAVGADGEVLGIRRLPITFRHDLEALAVILAQARKVGYAEVQPHAALVVSAVDLTWAADHQEQAGDWTRRAAVARGWAIDDGQHFSESVLVRRLRERRRAGSSYNAPLGIFPICADDIADLLMGRFDFAAVLSVEALRPAFAARRINVEFAKGSEASQTFLRARRDGGEVILPANMRAQMLRELMTVETLVRIVDFLLEDRSPEAGHFGLLCRVRGSGHGVLAGSSAV